MTAVGARVCIQRTGDEAIDQYAGHYGQIEDTRTINDCGYCYAQVAVRTDAGDLVWVNDDEVRAD